MNYPVQCDLEVKYTFVCHQCGATLSSFYRVVYGCRIPIPGIPENWVVIDRMLFCNLHKINVDVDDRTYPVMDKLQ